MLSVLPFRQYEVEVEDWGMKISSLLLEVPYKRVPYKRAFLYHGNQLDIFTNVY